MLGNRVKRMLREQKWHEYINEYKNPYDAWSNVRKSVHNAMDEFPLLVNLPKEKQEQLFTPENIKKILKCLTSIDVSHSKKVEIAAQLAIYGITICKKEYQILNQDVPDIARITSDHLDLAIRVCNDISYKSITNSLETSALEKNETYLLNWHKALDRDKARLERFIVKLIKERCEVFNLRYLGNKTIIEGQIGKPKQNGGRTFNLQVYPYEHKVVFKINDVTAYIDKINSKIGDTKVNHRYEKKIEVITPKPAFDNKTLIIKHHYEKKVKVIIDNSEFLLYERKN